MDYYINPRDVIEKFIRSSGKGGQNVNKVATCVYLKHIPTGIEVKCGSERTQMANRKKAWDMLREKIQRVRTLAYRAKIDEIEKNRRQTRLKPKSIKSKILDDKKVNSEKKKLRKKVDFRKEF